MWGATPTVRSGGAAAQFQSTHPVWGATSRCSLGCPAQSGYFNPRTPCGVRPSTSVIRSGSRDFNPRTPCGVRPEDLRAISFRVKISIHAPRVGCDESTAYRAGLTTEISIHAPRVGCDGYCLSCNTGFDISIHAPRVGCDNTARTFSSGWSYFNPRTPCGVRHGGHTYGGKCHDFNPRTPCGVRRVAYATINHINVISIHAPRVGCDKSPSGSW